MAAKQRAHTCCLNRAQLCRLVLRQRLPPAGGRRGDRPAHHFGPGLGLAGEWLGERACHVEVVCDPRCKAGGESFRHARRLCDWLVWTARWARWLTVLLLK